MSKQFDLTSDELFCCICGEDDTSLLFYHGKEIRCEKCIPTGDMVEQDDNTFDEKKPEKLN